MSDTTDEDATTTAGEGDGGERPPSRSPLAERRWSFVAAACLVAAAVLWPTVGVDAAFVVATLGAVAWFWDQRLRIGARYVEPVAEPDDEADEDEDEDGDVSGVEDDDERGGESDDERAGGVGADDEEGAGRERGGGL